MVNLKGQRLKKALSCGFLISFILFVAAEVTLLKLAAWQYDRMQQREAENAAVANIETVTLTGAFNLDAPTYLLEHQQHRINAGTRTGWRVLSLLATQDGQQLWVDRGWTPYLKGNNRLNPDFTAYAPPAEELTLTGQRLDFPTRHEGGWGGATTTTHPQILAFLDKDYIKSDAPHYFQTLTDTSTEARISAAFPPLKSPARHQEYMLTWLALALILPLLYGGLIWQRLRK